MVHVVATSAGQRSTLDWVGSGSGSGRVGNESGKRVGSGLPRGTNKVLTRGEVNIYHWAGIEPWTSRMWVKGATTGLVHTFKYIMHKFIFIVVQFLVRFY